MCEGFIPEQIINVLDGMKDFEIFGSKSLSFISTEDDRIKYNLEYFVDAFKREVIDSAHIDSFKKTVKSS